MKRHNELKALSIDILIRLWFRLLWQKYDLGGISVGRSMRCDLLDCFLDFMPTPELPGSLDEYSDGLEEEILRRPTCKYRRRPMALEQIASCTKQEVALMGLGALLALEWSVDSDIAWRSGYELERKRIKQVLRRFAYIPISRRLDLDGVCKAILARKSDIEHQQAMEGFNAPLENPDTKDP